MKIHTNGAKALFLCPGGNIYPDTLVCSGTLPPELGGKPCPYSQAGRMPDPVPLDPDASTYTIERLA